MSTDHTNETPHQRVTKAEACRRLGVSLSTLDRRIAEGQLEVERVQQGLVHRVLVLLPRDMPEVGPDAQGRAAAVSALQERITGLEALLEERGQRLADWEMRYQQQRADHESEIARLTRALPAPAPAETSPVPPTVRKPWWKVW